MVYFCFFPCRDNVNTVKSAPAASTSRERHDETNVQRPLHRRRPWQNLGGRLRAAAFPLPTTVQRRVSQAVEATLATPSKKLYFP